MTIVGTTIRFYQLEYNYLKTNDTNTYLRIVVYIYIFYFVLKYKITLK